MQSFRSTIVLNDSEAREELEKKWSKYMSKITLFSTKEGSEELIMQQHVGYALISAS